MKLLLKICPFDIFEKVKHKVRARDRVMITVKIKEEYNRTQNKLLLKHASAV